jgi:hypothetical protein
MEAWFVYLEHLQVLTFASLAAAVKQARLLEERAVVHYDQALSHSVLTKWFTVHKDAQAEAVAFELTACTYIEGFRKVRAP